MSPTTVAPDSLQFDTSRLRKHTPAESRSRLSIVILSQPGKQPDQQLSNWLEAQFRTLGHQVFADRPTSIGEEWGREIGRRIHDADVVIALFSAASMQSEMLSYQLQLAHQAAASRWGKPRVLPVRIDDGSSPDEFAFASGLEPCFLWKSEQDNRSLIEWLTAEKVSPEAPGSVKTRPPFEQESGAMPLDSRYYVVRPVDDEFYQAVGRRDSIILLKGARQMGKTSLLSRALATARAAGLRVVYTDFQALSDASLQSAKALYLALGTIIADQLDLEKFPHEVWRDFADANTNFGSYFQREVLRPGAQPLVWAMDEVDRLFGYPFASEVFGLFRAWRNASVADPARPWGRLTMAIVYATEAHLFITDLNQSPFNVGTRLRLDDFTLEQAADLNRRYGQPLPDAAAVARFFHLLGGQPYLTRRGLREMSEHGLDINALEARASLDEGIFSDHLRRMVVLISQDAALVSAMREVLRGRSCLDHAAFYRLRSAGVLAGDTLQDAHPRCRLYANYLKEYLL